MDLMATGGLGPITRVLLLQLWKQLFDPTSSVYLPDLIREHGLDPASVPEPQPIPLPVPDPITSLLCSSKDRSGKGDGEPNLTLDRITLAGLHAVEKGSLGFSSSKPTFTASVKLGHLSGTAIPLNLVIGALALHVPCCDPDDCAGDKWTSTVGGSANVVDSEATLTMTVEVADHLDLTITELIFATEPDDVTIDVKVDGEGPIVTALVDAAVKAAKPQLINALSAFLDSDPVRAELSRLLNEATKAVSG